MAQNRNINQTILVDGSVGIGETSPSTKLYIKNTAGDADITLQGSSQTMRIDQNSIKTTTASQIAIFTNNTTTNGIYISSTGNVGIGTTSPVSNWLSGFDPSTGNGTFKLTSEGWIVTPYLAGLASYYPAQGARPIIWSDDNGTNIQSWDNSATDGISLRSSNGTTRLFVKEDGNVGIGTTAPDQKLTVQGGVNSVWSFSTNTTDQPGFVAADNTTFGTATNILYLKQYGSAIAGNIFGNSIASKSIVASDGSASTGLIVGTFNAQPLIIGTNNTERMRITSGGNVGIGTTSPNYKLSIVSTSGAQLELINSATSKSWRPNVDGSDFAITETGVGVPFIIKAGGNVGIGTSSPGEKLTVNGAIGYQYSGTQTWHTYANSANSWELVRSGIATRMLVTSDGNVGIGTSSPNTKLEVFDGDISVTTSSTFSFLNLNRNFIPNSSGVLLGGTKFRGYSTGTTYQSGVHIYGYSNEAWTSTSTPGYLSIQTTSSGSTTPVERMVVTSAGNVGIGVIPSDWSVITGFQVGSGASLSGYQADEALLAANTYYNSGFKYVASAYATAYQQQNGVHKWLTASSGIAGNAISFSQSMTLTNDGNLGIGTTSPTAKLHVAGDAIFTGSGAYNSISVYNTGAAGGGGFLAYQNGVAYAYFGTAGWYTGTTDTGLVVGTDSSSRPIRFYTSTERMRITGDGNVGIGTTSPQKKLDVRGGYFITSDGGSNEVAFVQGGNGYAYFGNYSTGKAAFGNSENWTTLVADGGNVGIGETNIDARLHITSIGAVVNQKFEINGVAAWRIGIPNGQTYFAFDNSADALTSPKMVLDSAGNVGIGTTAPGAQLHVNSSSTSATSIYVGNTSTGASRIYFDAQNGDFAGNDYGYIGQANSGYMEYNVGTSSPAPYHVFTNGNVGIGTNSPTEKLEVQNGTAGAKIKVSNSVGGYASLECSSNATSVAQLSFTNQLSLIGGNVGIGTTSPSHKLHVNGGSIFGSSNILASNNVYAAGPQGFVFGSSTSEGEYIYRSGNDIRIHANGGDRLTVLGSGNVGIGTTSPSEKLHVIGNTNVSGYVYTSTLYVNNTNGTAVVNAYSGGQIGTYLAKASSATANFTTTGVSYPRGLGFGAIIGQGNTTDIPVNNASWNGGYGGNIGFWSDVHYGAEGGTNSIGFNAVIKGSGNSNSYGFFSDLSGATDGVRYGIYTKGEQQNYFSGNVGIGTSNPSIKLHVVGDGYFTSSVAITSGVGTAVGQLSLYASPATGVVTNLITAQYSSNVLTSIQSLNTGGYYQDLIINTSNGNGAPNLVEVFRIKGQTGNVGIGTTSPGAKLDVAGNVADTYIQVRSQDTSVGSAGEGARVRFSTSNETFLGHAGYVYRSASQYGVHLSSKDDIHFEVNNTTTAAVTVKASGNVLIGTTTDNGKKLQVNGDIFIKGSTSSSAYADAIFEVQNSNGTSIMDFRGDAYAFFGCGQGGGAASGFIFRYNDTSHVQFTGYNYGNGTASYKPILLDTDLVGRGQGIYVNFGGTGYANPAPTSSTEFAVRGRTSDATENVMELRDSNNAEKFVVKNDGSIVTDGSQGWTGTVAIPNNPPGSQNLEFKNGILINVF